MAMGTGNTEGEYPLNLHSHNFSTFLYQWRTRKPATFSLFCNQQFSYAFDTHLFSVSSLSAKGTIYVPTILSPGWDLGISLLCDVF